MVWQNGNLNPQNAGQSSADQNLLSALATNGISQTSMILIALWIYGKVSWYLNLLFLTTYGISWATYAVVHNGSSNFTVKSNIYDKCGNIGPTGFCPLYSSPRDQVSVQISNALFIGLVMVDFPITFVIMGFLTVAGGTPIEG